MLTVADMLMYNLHEKGGSNVPGQSMGFNWIRRPSEVGLGCDGAAGT
jgi:hypothetical protein